MLDFHFYRNEKTNEEWLETSLSGKPLLAIPQLNKLTAFSLEERMTFQLMGKLPNHIETLEEQVTRAYLQFLAYDSDLKRNIYLNNLHDKNQVLFYKLVSEHLTEMIPTIYTPIVGTAVKSYSQEFRQPRGLYISYPDANHLDFILDCRTNPDIDLIVITDGEGVLGIGDQGVGAMDIPIAKLMVYTLCGGINPYRTLPICLDVGTNNPTLLADPMYLGWQHPRISGQEYDAFIEAVVDSITRKFPHIFLHWEDFGNKNARRLLYRYQDRLATFNDDIQGTGAVALAAILSACELSRIPLSEQRIVIMGAGTAGIGITDQLYNAMVNHQRLSPEEARKRFWLVDRHGLVHEGLEEISPGQFPYARTLEEKNAIQSKSDLVELADVVKHVKPTILIGCSAVAGAFTEEIIKTMSMHCESPIIFPLSNPTERAEATPEDIFTWTEGKALVASGSPFEDVKYKGKSYQIAQCNNALVFPGIGLGVLAVKANQLTDGMIWKATQALATLCPRYQDADAPILPLIKDSQAAAKKIALAVAEQAIQEGVASQEPDRPLSEIIDNLFWEPHYVPYRRISPHE